MLILPSAKLFPDVRLETSSISINLLFNTDVGNLEYYLVEVVVEGGNVFDLFPLRQLISSNLHLIERFKTVEERCSECRPCLDVLVIRGGIVNIPPLMRYSFEVAHGNVECTRLWHICNVIGHLCDPA